MNRLLLSALLCSVAAYGAELTYRPVSVTFVPPISTYGTDGRNTVSDFSFNIIGGHIGSVRAFELGGIFNIVRYDLRGGQLAGVVNIVRGNVRGGQLAPVNIAGNLRGIQLGSINVNRGDLNGVKLGNVNVSHGDARGILAGNINVACDLNGVQAGNVNVSHRAARGVQAGNVNVGGDMTGLQAGNVNITSEITGLQVGNVNISGDFRGLQIGNVNISGDFRGHQIGNVNVADSGRGLMVGNVNICSHLDGEALGNISIIGNGYRAYSAWTDETGTAGFGVKLGSRHIYNVFGLGAAALADPGPRWFFAYGLGGHIPLRDRFYLDLDAANYFLSEPGSLRRARGEYLLRLRPQFGVNIVSGISLLAGPVFSLRITGEEPTDRLTSLPLGFFEGELRPGRNWYQAWAGLMAGFQLNRTRR